MFLCLFFPAGAQVRNLIVHVRMVPLTNNNMYHLLQEKKGKDNSSLKIMQTKKRYQKIKFGCSLTSLQVYKIALGPAGSFTTYVFAQSSEDVCTDFNSNEAQLIYSK